MNKESEFELKTAIKELLEAWCSAASAEVLQRFYPSGMTVRIGAGKISTGPADFQQRFRSRLSYKIVPGYQINFLAHNHSLVTGILAVECEGEQWREGFTLILYKPCDTWYIAHEHTSVLSCSSLGHTILNRAMGTSPTLGRL